jgi:DNA-binding HxlR family transcriptional regulator
LNQLIFERPGKMEKTDFAAAPCPVARSLERVGEWWNILILRDCFYGLARFDEFQRSLGISTNLLTRRLNQLVDDELLQRRQYCERPPRYEYVLTDKGRDFRPVLFALVAWGNRHFAPEGATIEVHDSVTGLAVEPVLIDGLTGEPLTEERHHIGAGPAATESTFRRLAFAEARRNQQATMTGEAQ